MADTSYLGTLDPQGRSSLSLDCSCVAESAGSLSPCRWLSRSLPHSLESAFALNIQTYVQNTYRHACIHACACIYISFLRRARFFICRFACRCVSHTTCARHTAAHTLRIQHTLLHRGRTHTHTHTHTDTKDEGTLDAASALRSNERVARELLAHPEAVPGLLSNQRISRVQSCPSQWHLGYGIPSTPKTNLHKLLGASTRHDVIGLGCILQLSPSLEALAEPARLRSQSVVFFLPGFSFGSLLIRMPTCFWPLRFQVALGPEFPCPAAPNSPAGLVYMLVSPKTGPIDLFSGPKEGTVSILGALRLYPFVPGAPVLMPSSKVPTGRGWILPSFPAP